MTATATSSNQVRSAFDFTVDKFPLYGPENLQTDQYGLFRSDTGYINGVCAKSKGYEPHTTDDVCVLVEAAESALGDSAEIRCHWNRGHYVLITPSTEHRKAIYGSADNIFLRVVIQAGYDGQAFSGSAAYYRDACSNLVIPQRLAGIHQRIRHTSSLRSKMDTLEAQFSQLHGGWERVVAMAQEMESREIRMVDFLNRIYGVPEESQLQLAATGARVRSVTLHKNRTEQIWNRLNRERIRTGRPLLQDDRVSGWEAFNAIQGYTQHDLSMRGTNDDVRRILRAASNREVRLAEELVLAS